MIGTGPGEAGRNVLNLLGVPLRKTNKISAVSCPSGTETFMVGGRWSDFMIGEGEGMRIEVSTENRWETDELDLRLVRIIGSMLVQPTSFVIIKGITE